MHTGHSRRRESHSPAMGPKRNQRAASGAHPYSKSWHSGGREKQVGTLGPRAASPAAPASEVRNSEEVPAPDLGTSEAVQPIVRTNASSLVQNLQSDS